MPTSERGARGDGLMDFPRACRLLLREEGAGGAKIRYHAVMPVAHFALPAVLAFSAACALDAAVDDTVERSEGPAPGVLGSYVQDGGCEGHPEGASCRTTLILRSGGEGTFIGDNLVEEITWFPGDESFEAELPWGATRFEVFDEGWTLIDDRYGLDWYRSSD